MNILAASPVLLWTVVLLLPRAAMWLATAAGANISVTVEEQQEEVHEVEVIDQFNTGYEDVENT